MITKPTTVLIGTALAWDAQGVADNADFTTFISPGEAVPGTVAILQKDFSVMPAAGTMTTSDVIYIAQILPDTYDYTSEDGTSVSVTAAHKVKFSAPIHGNHIISAEGRKYDAKGEQTTTFTDAACPVLVGTELVLRIVYKDLDEHPGQFAHTYHYTIPAGATIATINAAIAAKVNKHSGRRVTATGAATLALAGREISDCCTGLSDINEFRQVRFEAFLNYIDADGYPTEWGATVATTAADAGVGNWEQIRDIEKYALGYKGITNHTNFPVPSAVSNLYTVVDNTYDVFTIESYVPYKSSDNTYTKLTPVTTVIAIAVGSTQAASLQTTLNAWLLTTPKMIVPADWTT